MPPPAPKTHKSSAGRDRIFSIGLTGGIGSGKSTVAALFARRGVPVIDADQIAHELTAAGMPAATAIADAFGPEVVGSDGSLDRGRLRRIVFSDQAARQRIEAIVHPLVRDRIADRQRSLAGDYCIVVVPLLIEVEMEGLVDRILVVDCDEERGITRAAGRDGTPAAEIAAIAATQAGRRERLARADDIISNEGSADELGPAVAALDRRYRELAATGALPDEHGE